MNICHSCGAGKIDDGQNGCKNLNYCDSSPCYKGTCQNVTKAEGFFLCVCPAGWSGRLCSGTIVEPPDTNPQSNIALIVGIVAGVIGKSSWYLYLY